jgi:hypothetical protein
VAAQTQEAPSVNKAELRQKVLNLIPGQAMASLFQRPHLDRELIIGIIGLRGGGKSASGASIAFIDYMLKSKPVWSNMNINCDIEIDDITGRSYDLHKGGVAKYASYPLEKEALLNLDDRYRNGCLVIDEINVQYSNVRRFMSNTNVDFNIVCQQLRKFKLSLIYSVIDEMFIDSELRSLTSIFIKSEDIALSSDGLESHKQPGSTFKWTIYPMDGWMNGIENSYAVTHKPLAPWYFHFHRLRGIYDTNLYQKSGKYSMSTKEKNKSFGINNPGSMVVPDFTESPDSASQFNEWGWLEQKIIQLRDMEVDEIYPYELWDFLALKDRNISVPQIQNQLSRYGIYKPTKGYPKYCVNYKKIDDVKKGALSHGL